MDRTTLVLVTSLIVVATAPCHAAMATPPPFAPELPDHIIATLASWLDHRALTVLALLVPGLPALRRAARHALRPFALRPFVRRSAFFLRPSSFVMRHEA